MELIGELPEAERKVLLDAKALLAELSRVGSCDPQTAEKAVGVLSRLRELVYEDLNQIQHEYMILDAVRYLVDNSIVPANTLWQWNPRQTGGADEPDLEGKVGESVLVSAEVTTSRKPEGTIKDRMRNTLRKLQRDQIRGQKYYFVRTAAMERKARSIVEREGATITIVRLNHATVEL